MMTFLAMVIFSAALAASFAVFAFTLAPALPRIAALLAGEQYVALAAQPTLMLRDRARRPVTAAPAPRQLARAVA